MCQKGRRTTVQGSLLCIPKKSRWWPLRWCRTGEKARLNGMAATEQHGTVAGRSGTTGV